MYAQAGKANEENQSSAVANSVAQKKNTEKRGFGFVDNRAEAKSQKSVQLMLNNSAYTIQRRDAISKRKKLNKNVTKAIRLIQNGGPQGSNASRDEVKAHDEAMNPGQHHQFRNVKRSMLVSDLEQRKSDHANNNIRDSTLKNEAEKEGNGDLVLQL